MNHLYSRMYVGNLSFHHIHSYPDIENEDYRFSCHGDYNLTITNFTCENVLLTSVTTTPSTTIIASTPPNDCPIGYLQRYSGECVDEDECDYNNSCQYSCVNTEGSFYCDCYGGYKLDGNPGLLSRYKYVRSVKPSNTLLDTETSSFSFRLRDCKLESCDNAPSSM